MEENRGQADSRFDYVARGPGYGLYLSGGEILFGLRRGSDRIFILEVHVDEGLSGPFLNTVEAAAEGDQDAENNSSTAPAVAAAPGNANADGAFNAADIVLLVLEINDGDGEDVFAADGGTFQGNPTMDVDGDGLITLADYDALVLLIFPPSVPSVLLIRKSAF